MASSAIFQALAKSRLAFAGCLPKESAGYQPSMKPPFLDNEMGFYNDPASDGSPKWRRRIKRSKARIPSAAVAVRRSQRSRMSWQRFVGLADFWIPRPKILHPYPNVRFYAKHPK
jgi:hypothetical protein